MIRPEEESKRKKEGGRRKEAHFLIAALVYKHYIFNEIHSLLLSSAEFSSLGSLFVGLTVPDSSWHVHACMQQIEFHSCTDWNLIPISQAELLWRLKISLAELNLKEPEIFGEVSLECIEREERNWSKVEYSLGKKKEKKGKEKQSTKIFSMYVNLANFAVSKSNAVSLLAWL